MLGKSSSASISWSFAFVSCPFSPSAGLWDPKSSSSGKWWAAFVSVWDESHLAMFLMLSCLCSLPPLLQMTDLFFFMFLLSIWVVAYGVAKQGILIHNDVRLDWILRGAVYEPYRIIFGDFPTNIDCEWYKVGTLLLADACVSINLIQFYFNVKNKIQPGHGTYWFIGLIILNKKREQEMWCSTFTAYLDWPTLVFLQIKDFSL